MILRYCHYWFHLHQHHPDLMNHLNPLFHYRVPQRRRRLKGVSLKLMK
jgi:hypothetical protein